MNVITVKSLINLMGCTEIFLHSLIFLFLPPPSFPPIFLPFLIFFSLPLFFVFVFPLCGSHWHWEYSCDNQWHPLSFLGLISFFLLFSFSLFFLFLLFPISIGYFFSSPSLFSPFFSSFFSIYNLFTIFHCSGLCAALLLCCQLFPSWRTQAIRTAPPPEGSNGSIGLGWDTGFPCVPLPYVASVGRRLSRPVMWTASAVLPWQCPCCLPIGFDALALSCDQPRPVSMAALPDIPTHVRTSVWAGWSGMPPPRGDVGIWMMVGRGGHTLGASHTAPGVLHLAWLVITTQSSI